MFLTVDDTKIKPEVKNGDKTSIMKLKKTNISYCTKGRQPD